MKTFLLLFICAALAIAQSTAVLPATVPVGATPVVPGASAPNYPTYMIGMGGGLIRNNGLPKAWETWISGSAGLGGGNYLETTLDLTSINTIRFGYAKIFSLGN